MELLARKKLIALELLATHGVMYALEMCERSTKRLKRGTIYPTLYALELDGYVTSREEEQPQHRGLPRRYYEITAEGRRVVRAAHAAATILADPLPPTPAPTGAKI